MTDKEFQLQYCIERYRWAKENGQLDKLYPIIGRLFNSSGL